MGLFTTRQATAADVGDIRELLPRLADFPAPRRMTSEDVWRYDAAAVDEWAAGNRPQTWVRVAVDENDRVLGTAIASMIEDSFTGQSAVHLEVVVIHPSADGQGLGQRLMAEIEADGRERGATVMSLTVMVANAGARSLYARLGFDEEMIRASKPLR